MTNKNGDEFPADGWEKFIKSQREAVQERQKVLAEAEAELNHWREDPTYVPKLPSIAREEMSGETVRIGDGRGQVARFGDMVSVALEGKPVGGLLSSTQEHFISELETALMRKDYKTCGTIIFTVREALDNYVRGRLMAGRAQLPENTGDNSHRLRFLLRRLYDAKLPGHAAEELRTATEMFIEKYGFENDKEWLTLARTTELPVNYVGCICKPERVPGTALFHLKEPEEDCPTCARKALEEWNQQLPLILEQYMRAVRSAHCADEITIGVTLAGVYIAEIDAHGNARQGVPHIFKEQIK